MATVGSICEDIGPLKHRVSIDVQRSMASEALPSLRRYVCFKGTGWAPRASHRKDGNFWKDRTGSCQLSGSGNKMTSTSSFKGGQSAIVWNVGMSIKKKQLMFSDSTGTHLYYGNELCIWQSLALLEFLEGLWAVSLQEYFTIDCYCCYKKGEFSEIL